MNLNIKFNEPTTIKKDVNPESGFCDKMLILDANLKKNTIKIKVKKSKGKESQIFSPKTDITSTSKGKLELDTSDYGALFTALSGFKGIDIRKV